MTRTTFSALAALALVSLIAIVPAGAEQRLNYMNLFTDAEAAHPHVTGTSYTVDQDFVDGQWEGIIAASDGRTYFSISSHSTDRNAQFYVYAPQADEVVHLIDVGVWCGEVDMLARRNTQGKIHSEIYEVDGKLYCTTTSAHRSELVPYLGGYFLSYDLKTGEFEDLGRYDDTVGGMLTMHYEPVYKRLYAISQGRQMLVYYDMKSGEIVEVAPAESDTHQCRSLISDKHGNVYGSEWGGLIYKYNPRTNKITHLETKVPHDPNAPQPAEDPDGLHWRGTNWGMMVWDPETEWWYGVRTNDEYLFRFRPPAEPDGKKGQAEGLAPFGYAPSAEAQPRYGSLGFCRMGRKLYYCSYPMWRSQAYLMSYDLDTQEVTNHGKIVLEGGRRVSEIHSFAPGSDGTLHAVAMVWSIEGEDPANPWANRAGCYFHPRFVRIDPKTDFKNQGDGRDGE